MAAFCLNIAATRDLRQGKIGLMLETIELGETISLPWVLSKLVMPGVLDGNFHISLQ